MTKEHKHSNKRKLRPYGLKKGFNWCACDSFLEIEATKKTARYKAKQDIKKEIIDTL